MTAAIGRLFEHFCLRISNLCKMVPCDGIYKCFFFVLHIDVMGQHLMFIGPFFFLPFSNRDTHARSTLVDDTTFCVNNKN
ncbi:hypothetical protein Y032_0175g498 [Ancylostoma ceylanicum]|uniref:Uncharacterized protein n=1 Tax=Ancylostoma ceylanicum TaxID=53326 RepID=A0A016STV4_9BILA|nr:hypothetical protein Y032_0175g498 [Ancylostoma ceylanicum]